MIRKESWTVGWQSSDKITYCTPTATHVISKRSKWSRFHTGYASIRISWNIKICECTTVRRETTSLYIPTDRRWVLLNSITPSISEGVCQHKTAFNHNFLRDSTGYNDRSHAVPAPLGCLLKVIGAGTGVAHVEIENMVIDIFKYPWWSYLVDY